MVLSKRAEKLEPSVTLAASAKAKALKDQGIDVLPQKISGQLPSTLSKRVKSAFIHRQLAFLN